MRIMDSSVENVKHEEIGADYSITEVLNAEKNGL